MNTQPPISTERDRAELERLLREATKVMKLFQAIRRWWRELLAVIAAVDRGGDVNDREGKQ